MSELRQISTTTEVTRVSGVISIDTKYLQDTNSLYVFIASNSGMINDVTYLHGEEIAVINKTNVNLIIDNDGNLVVSASDSNKYSIDSDGQLQYIAN